MLGMGSFGSALASRLAANGCRVTGVDTRRDRLDAVKNVIHEAIIGDATDRELLENLPIKDSTSVFISLGETISRSLLATLHVKELGARDIVVKGVTPGLKGLAVPFGSVCKLTISKIFRFKSCRQTEIMEIEKLVIPPLG